MARRLAAAVHVLHPKSNEWLILLPGDEPDEDLAEVITNPAAWEPDDDEDGGEGDGGEGETPPATPTLTRPRSPRPSPSLRPRRTRSPGRGPASRPTRSRPCQTRPGTPMWRGCRAAPLPWKDPLVDSAVLAWLLAQLGPTTDQGDLQTRYTRLGEARAVALEVLSERRAKLLADPLQLTVNGVVTMDQSNNLTGLERQIASVEAATAPDDVAGGDTLVIAPLESARRRRHHWWR
ncbi:hypothetical protein [Streptomyces sp. NPDC047009]|uniref:hypothetical protein n=1 Tax=Streptomyces sp. NPDC047009 TaxID=3154496 RepID=UPI0033DDAEE1